MLTSGSSNIIIGYDLDPSAANASNEVNIGGIYRGNTSNGDVQLAAPSSAPSVVGNSFITFWIDEVNNELQVEAKYSDGTTKTATIAFD